MSKAQLTLFYGEPFYILTDRAEYAAAWLMANRRVCFLVNGRVIEEPIKGTIVRSYRLI